MEFEDGTNLGLIESARSLLAISGDEWNRRSFSSEIEDNLDLRHLEIESFRDDLSVIWFKHRKKKN
jgi:hypothetical protein